MPTQDVGDPPDENGLGELAGRRAARAPESMIELDDLAEKNERGWRVRSLDKRCQVPLLARRLDGGAP